MELSRLSGGASIYGSSAITEQVTAAARKPAERLSQQAESTRVQLSAYGQLKSATAQVESAAKKLQDNSSLGSAADVTKTAKGFADAVNSEVKAANQAAQSSRNVRASRELRRAVEGFTAKDRNALSQAGISFGQDGTMKVDTKKLEAAYQANPDQVKETLARVGKAAAEVSTKQVSDNGAVGGAINRLNEKLGTINQQQANHQANLAQAQKAVQEQERRANELQQTASQQAFGFNGVGAYNQVYYS
ncbi:MAG TPA: flagellar filament capping protein FliD [Rhodocyclaceae bacterium]|nr:flagellar filament capping protein FliD [Rhodocyclaceae bacterium]